AWHVATQAQRDQLLAAWERQDKEIIHQLVNDLNARQFLVGASLDHRRQALQALEQLSNNGDPAVLTTLQGLVNELTLLPDRLLVNL
nr:hypothetical protein [Ardenticatenales bacterium]